MNYFDAIIKNAIANNKTICICVNKIDWDKRCIGFVGKYVPMELLILVELNSYGNIVRHKTVLFKNIASIEFGGEYNDNLESCYINNIKKKRKPKYVKFSNTKSFYQHLDKLINKRTICSFFANDCYTIGLLKEISNGQILINNISFFGKDDGITSYYLTSLTSIRYDGPLESNVSFLLNR